MHIKQAYKKNFGKNTEMNDINGRQDEKKAQERAAIREERG